MLLLVTSYVFVDPMTCDVLVVVLAMLCPVWQVLCVSAVRVDLKKTCEVAGAEC